MKTALFFASAVVLWGGVILEKSFAQEEGDKALERRILEKVEERLQAHRKRLLQEISGILHAELSGPSAVQPKKAEPPDKKTEKEETDKDEEDKQEGKLAQDEAQQLFEQSYKLHEQKKYKEAIAGFEKIFRQMPEESLGYTSAYNIACAYALLGDKPKALDWLEKAVKHGFRNFDHMQNDPDLDTLHDELRYQKLIEQGDEEGDEE